MMRDSGFEVCYENKWFRMQKGEIKSYKQVREESNKKWYDNNEDAEQCLYDF
jgi:ribonucleotide reductase alpha subunit